MAWYDFFMGSPEKHKRISTLLPEQQPLAGQLFQAGQQRGAGGAFGSAADFYRDILDNNPEMLEQLFAPEMRRFRQDIVPGLAEQFAGMGSGALSSSGFRNAATQAGTDLSERLAAMRMGLRQNAAQGLQGIGQLGLGNYSQDVVTEPGTEGMFSKLGPALASAGIGFLTGGPAGAAIGGLSGLFGGGGLNPPKGSTNPYGGANAASSAQLPFTYGR